MTFDPRRKHILICAGGEITRAETPGSGRCKSKWSGGGEDLISEMVKV